MHSLRAPEPPIILPGVLDDHSSLHHPNNLGNKPGVACRVDRQSRGSLQEASLPAQKLAESFPVLDRTAPALHGKSLTRSLSEPTPLRQLAFEEGTRQKLQQHDPPPTQLRYVVSQLRAELCTLQHVVRQLAELQSVACSKTRDNIELEETSAHNQTNNNNSDNNNNNNNNNNDHNTNIQESSLGSLDLDDDNPESSLSGSEPDLDESSLASFDPNGDEASSLDNLGHQTMTVASSLGSLDQQEDKESSSSFDQEGMMLGTIRDPSLETTRTSFGKTKPKRRVTFSKATLAAYNEKTQTKENRCCKTARACWNNAQQEYQSIGHATTTTAEIEKVNP